MSFLLRFKLFTLLALLLTLTLNLTGCTFPPRLYKTDIRQGNCISEEMIASIRRGMTKTQVQEIFGSPILSHCFNTDRWDYYYYFKPGMGNGQTIEKRFTIFFKGDRVIGWE